MIDALEATGNPSSVHQEGRRARAGVEAARRAVAALVDGDPDDLVFTSGATEAAALALSPDLGTGVEDPPAARLLVSVTEHPAVLQGHRFAADRVRLLPVGRDGRLDLDVLASALAGKGRSILALQVANSETGVIQPVAEAAALVHARGGLLVCDAVQGVGRVDCRFARLGADVLLLSSHKLGGPQGVGAVALASEALRVSALLRGGGQERGRRAGTENGPAIAGFGAAAREVLAGDEAPRVLGLRQRLESRLRALVPDVVIFGETSPRLPNTTAFAVPGLANDVALIGLDLDGVAVSTGSACSSGKVARSHVLEAMGVDLHLCTGLIRVSLGWSSTATDVDRFIDVLGSVARRARRQATRAAA